MKKLLLIIGVVLLTSTLSAQKLTNYQKYWQAREDSIAQSQNALSNNATENQITSAKSVEYDDLYFQPSKDGKRVKHVRKRNLITEDTLLYNAVDTLVKENPDIQVNYIYNDDPFFYSNRIGMFYHGGFNYWHYNPFFYDPWYDFDFGWGWNPYFGYTYPYWGYPYYNDFYFGWNNYWGLNFDWNWYHPYYWHNDYRHNNNWYGHNNYYGYNQQSQYNRRERPSNLINNQISSRRIQPQQNIISSQNKTTYQQNRREYTPSYQNPRMSVRPQYNNTRSNFFGGNRRTTATEQRSTQTRTYSTPSRSYSTPSRSSSSSFSRGSFSSGGGSRSSGSSGGRSSGGSSFSGGGRRR
jgi:hypothetical protein